MHGEEPQLYMVRKRRLRRGEGTPTTRGEEPQLCMVRERRLHVVRSRSYASVRERRLRVRLCLMRSRSYAW